MRGACRSDGQELEKGREGVARNSYCDKSAALLTSLVHAFTRWHDSGFRHGLSGNHRSAAQ